MNINIRFSINTVCLCACIHTCLFTVCMYTVNRHVCVCIHIYTHICVYTNTDVYECLYVDMMLNVCVYVYVYVEDPTNSFVCMYYVHMKWRRQTSAA